MSHPVPPSRNADVADAEVAAGADVAAGAEPDFSAAPLLEVIAHAQARLAAGARAFAFLIADPDLGHGRYAGEAVEAFLHRPWRVWIELADRLGLRMRTPRPAGEHRLRLAFERLAPSARWQDEASGDRTAATEAPDPSPLDRTERYGARSGYARIAKAEEPGFVLDLAEALARCALPPSARVLDLGCNDGDELALMMALAPRLAGASFAGIDHSASALEVARRRFAHLPEGRMQLVCADLNALAADALGHSLGHALGRFDLVVSFGTLQSPGVDDRALLRQLVQHHLAPRGSLILGIPNCRYLDGELSHGARMRNFRQPELGLVVKDLAFYRKYLQQHDRQVFLTGHHTLLLTAVAR